MTEICAEGETMDEPVIRTTHSHPATWIRFGLLCGLWIWLCRSELYRFASASVHGSEMAHAVAFPFAAWILLSRRKSELISKSKPGSMGGVLFLFLSILAYASLQWPFSFAYAKDVIILLIFLAVAVAAAGWRFVWRFSPVILLAFLCIPMGSRLYATLIIYPETYTLIAVKKALSFLPGLKVWLEGVDILFEYAGQSGVVALGESNRGARLFLAYAFVGTFVTFSEIRSWSRLLFVALWACPILLLCNLLRLLLWAIAVILFPFGPLSGWPRILSTILSIMTAYLLFRFVCSPRLSLFVSETTDKERIPSDAVHGGALESPANYFSLVFLLSFFILCLSAFFLRPSLVRLAEHYRKESVPIRLALKQFTVSAMPSFQEGWQISSHEAPVEDLGTEEYVHLLLLRENKSLFPEHMELFITYYSDPDDNVPHTPDVCSRQAGDVVLQMKPVSLSCHANGLLHTPEGWYLLLEQEDGILVDIFLFYVDGRFRRDRQAVRWDIFKPGNRHVYFSKIEVAAKIRKGEDVETALQWCRRLFSEASPVLIEQHFPSVPQFREK